jgi:TetR/AcrR family transcriptional regulator, regulator of cefoperazone and chloramphenicol sensitivity
MKLDEQTQARPSGGSAAPQRNARELLLDAAERLFGESGIEAVSLREIAAAAGQRNNSAASYHFGDRKGLADALIADRIAKVERIRQRMIEGIDDLSACDAKQLLRLLWQPLLDVDAGRNRHFFVQFLLAYWVQNAGSGHPIATDPGSHPASTRIIDALRAHYAHLSREHFQYRLSLVGMMFWSAVSWHDHVTLSANQRWSTRFSPDEAIKLAVASLDAPS